MSIRKVRIAIGQVELRSLKDAYYYRDWDVKIHYIEDSSIRFEYDVPKIINTTNWMGYGGFTFEVMLDGSDMIWLYLEYMHKYTTVLEFYDLCKYECDKEGLIDG